MWAGVDDAGDVAYGDDDVKVRVGGGAGGWVAWPPPGGVPSLVSVVDRKVANVVCCMMG